MFIDRIMYRITKCCLLLLTLLCSLTTYAQSPKFKVIAFYTGQNDDAHISFVKEANVWFKSIAEKYHFNYESTTDWSKILDTRPEVPAQREAFEKYMRNGGAWLGFHFAAFALTPSSFKQNWDWYHNELLGSGQYASNTWRPTSAILKVERIKHPVTKNLPINFKSQPNEWYRWEKDLRQNPNIDILLAIDSSSFPLGTGPKQHEIWYSGYYPVVWSNKNYKMVYINMGHNDMDYQTKKNLSSSFGSQSQNKIIINSLLWLGKKR
jgi:hypothetical protein